MKIISTKEKIKKVALKLFSKRGYYGTTLTDIADAVGIVKASLYSHCSGKDDLFLAVTDDFMRDYKMLFDQLSEASEGMAIPEKLRYIFREYILHYMRNPLNFYFATKNIYLVKWTPMTEKLFDKIVQRYKKLDDCYRHQLESSFTEGMRQGIIRPGDPAKRTWSFKSNMNAALSLILMEHLGEKYIDEFWNDFWFGVAEKNENKAG